MTDDNPNYFWIATVQDWFRTSPANADCPLGVLNFCIMWPLFNENKQQLDKKEYT